MARPTRTTIRRLVDPRMAPPVRPAVTIALAVAALVFAAVLVDVPVVRAILLAAAAAIAIGPAIGFLLTGQRDSRQEMRDLWGLAHVAHDGKPWPAPGGWALGADAIALLLREMDERGSKTVVELGPGTSSVILGAAGPAGLEMVGLEHDPHFAANVASQLRLHGLDSYDLVHAPLRPHPDTVGRTVSWYDTAALDALPERIDVLIVDGPPNWKGRGDRAPAWEVLRDRLADNALVLVDDTHRPDERAMVNEWLRDGDLRVLQDAGQFVALEALRPAAPS